MGSVSRKRRRGQVLCVFVNRFHQLHRPHPISLVFAHSDSDRCRLALEEHVRRALNLSSLRTNDKKDLAWTLGDLAMWVWEQNLDDSQLHFGDLARQLAEDNGLNVEPVSM